MATMVVTGATSGIGREIALEFSRRHVSDCDSLVLCYRSDDLALEGLVGELSSWRGVFL